MACILHIETSTESCSVAVSEDGLAEFKLEDLQGPSPKYLLQIMQQFENLFETGADVTIVWYYSDEDMQELGNDYQQIVKVPFEFKKLSVQA